MTEPNAIEQAITEHWGDRCPDVAEGCPCCEAWAQYDALTGKPQSVTDEALIAACKAHDKEEAAQMGEPSPWEVSKDDIDPEWVANRVAAMRCAMAALPSGVRDGEIERLRGKLFKAEDRHEAEHRSHIRTGEARDKWRERAEAAEARVAELERERAELLQQSRKVRNFSNPDDVFEAIPVRALHPEQEQS